MLFLQERRRNAEVNAALEERIKVAEEERRQAEERAAEYRRQSDAERERAEQRMEELHLATMALIAKMSDAIDRYRKPAP